MNSIFHEIPTANVDTPSHVRTILRYAPFLFAFLPNLHGAGRIYRAARILTSPPPSSNKSAMTIDQRQVDRPVARLPEVT